MGALRPPPDLKADEIATPPSTALAVIKEDVRLFEKGNISSTGCRLARGCSFNECRLKKRFNCRRSNGLTL